MTTVSPKKSHDPARVNEISEKLMENSEIASLISELSSSADDASELVKGLLRCQMRVFGTGVLGTRYCRVPGSWYRAEGCVGPDR